LCTHAPTAKGLVEVANEFFFLHRPITLFDTVPQVVFPPFPTLLGRPVQLSPDGDKRLDGGLDSAGVVLQADMDVDATVAATEALYVTTELFVFL
jgi:hypothetical protein